MNRYNYLIIGVALFGAGIIIGSLEFSSSASANYCYDSTSICVLIDYLLPEPIEDAILNFQGLEDYLVLPSNKTYMQFSVSQLPQGTTPEKVLEYLEQIESNLERGNAQTAIIPLVYPSNSPAPLCLRDSDGSLAGLYIVNGQISIIDDDTKCFGECLQGPCNSLGPVYGVQNVN